MKVKINEDGGILRTYESWNNKPLLENYVRVKVRESWVGVNSHYDRQMKRKKEYRPDCVRETYVKEYMNEIAPLIGLSNEEWDYFID